MGLLLPETVVRDLRAQREREMREMASRAAVCDEFNPELRQIDPYLEMVFWPETASAPGMVPGRYHVVRHSPNAAASPVVVIEHPDGSYRDPDSRVFDDVRRGDLWNDEVVADRKRMIRAAQDAKDRRRLREIEERQEELRDRVNAVARTSVSMTDAAPWVQNENGRHGNPR